MLSLKKGSKLYVRVDKTGEQETTPQDFQDHLDYVKNVAKERFFLGGGFSNIDGGMILCEAKNLEEAQGIFHNDPLVERGLYRCEVFEWDLVILSGEDSE